MQFKNISNCFCILHNEIFQTLYILSLTVKLISLVTIRNIDNECYHDHSKCNQEGR